jgi:hypothetical protein
MIAKHFSFLAGLGLCAALLASTAQAADINVMLDQAKVIRLPEKIAMVVIGNPAIADVAMQKSGVAVVTGKTYGVTNMIILDAKGEMVSEQMVVVKAPNVAMVTVQRGVERETLTCTPDCERTFKLGDAPANFDAVTGQSSARSAFAAGQATAAPAR